MPKQEKTGLFIKADESAKHKIPPGFPERPERLIQLERALLPQLSSLGVTLCDFSPAALEAITSVHQEAVVEELAHACSSGKTKFRGSSDLPLCEETFTAARFACGSVIEAVDAVMTGKLSNAFCAIRPPGHHAFSDHPEGFCFFNNVGVGAQHLLNKYNLERVVILDWDLHHGNGTQEIFYDTDKVLFISVHGDPTNIYPYRSGYVEEQGIGKGEGYTLNVPLRMKSGDSELFKAWDEKVLPALHAYKPEFILISAGFDAHKNDPFHYLGWSSEAYDRLTKDMIAIAERYCKGRMVSVLEGGYSLEVLQEVVPRHLALLGGL